jgi:hypothetical protein
MPLDPAPLARHVAEFIDDLEQEYGEDAELLDAVVCVEVASTDEDGDTISTVEARSVSGRNTVAVGILTRSLDAACQTDYGD